MSAVRITRDLPRDDEAEKSVLGGVIVNNNTLVDVAGWLKAEHFAQPWAGLVFTAMLSLAKANQPIDHVSVKRALGENFSAVGMENLSRLGDGIPRSLNVEYHGRTVVDVARRRDAIQCATAVIDAAMVNGAKADDIIAQAQESFFTLASSRRGETVWTADQMTSDLFKELEDLADRDHAPTGLLTGIRDLDELTFGLQPGELVVVGARPSCGKALALSTRIPTPSGWSTMGDLSVGDQVFDEHGRPCTVTGVSPVYVGNSCYEVEFSDGTTIVADGDHQWFAYDHAAWKSLRERHYRLNGGYSDKPILHPRLRRDQSHRVKQPRVVTTAQMLSEGVIAPDGQRQNWRIPVAQPLELPHAEVPVDPYVLGCWLGDGNSRSAGMTIGASDAEHFGREFAAAGYRLTKLKGSYAYSTSPVSGAGRWRSYKGDVRHLSLELISAGLLRGAKKHIPAVYMRASIAQRMALLQGVMDTDGYLNPVNKRAEICLVSRLLLEQIRELACSLGQRPGPIAEKRIVLDDGRDVVAYRFQWTPTALVFRLERKSSRQRLARVHQRFFSKLMTRSIVSIRAVPSTPVRCIAVDSQSRLYLASESMISTHNSALTAQIAMHAAKTAPVLFASLEMKHRAIWRRAMFNLARVDGFKFVRGHLRGDQTIYSRISHALEHLNALHFVVDEQPGQTSADIHARARQMQLRHGLGLVVVDYLQLMRPVDPTAARRQNTSRTVGEMAWDLKEMAMALNVPVICVSQLSRIQDEKTRPTMAHLRECVVGSTRVIDADTGEWRQVSDLRAGSRVMSLDVATQKIRPYSVEAVWSTGKKPVFRVTTRTGRSIIATGNHPFLAPHGWQRVEELRPGSEIATAMRLPAHGLAHGVDPDLCRLLGYLAGDGTYQRHRCVGFISSDPETFRDVVTIVTSKFPGVRVSMKAQKGRCEEADFVATDANGHGRPRGNPLREWLRAVGVFGGRDRTKRVAACCFHTSDAARNFIAGYLSSDGCVKRRHGVWEVHFDSVSRELLEDVQALLIRIGVVSSINNGYTSVKGTVPIFRLSVAPSIQNLVRFAKTVPARGKKGDLLSLLASSEEPETSGWNVFSLPVCVSKLLSTVAPWRSKGTRRRRTFTGWRHQGKRLRREICAAWADRLNHEGLKTWAESDLLWERIESIEPAGEAEVFDLCVPGAANFIGNGIVAHNSGEIEQHADIVLLMHRKETRAEVEDLEIGAPVHIELLVEKQRGNPTAVLTFLNFRESYRFVSLASQGDLGMEAAS